MNTTNFELKQHFHIESARFLPHLSKDHPCSRMHGHSFKITLTLCGPLEPRLGWVQDFNEISSAMKPLLLELDHRVLNEIAGLENPTSENLSYWIFHRAKKALPLLTQVTVSETPETSCSYPSLIG